MKWRFSHHAIPIFKRPLKHATWIYDIRMNVQEKFKTRIVQMSFCPELPPCDSEEPRQRIKRQHHDSFMKSLLIIKTIKSILGLGKKTKVKRDVTCCRFDQKPSNAQLNKIEQHPSFTWISEQRNIDSINGYICYLVKMGFLLTKRLLLTNHQMQTLPSSLINSL